MGLAISRYCFNRLRDAYPVYAAKIRGVCVMTLYLGYRNDAGFGRYNNAPNTA
jgi:predicted membrane chloride channel (bestrophin family)